MQYLVSVIDDTADLARWRASGATAPPDEMAAIDAFNDRLAAEGHWVFSGGLAAPGTATVIDNRGGEALFTDGPFVESKEYLGGLWTLEAADLDVVLKLAAEGSKACNRKVEVRPFALMTTETETTAQEQIRTLLNDRAAAITAKDARRAVAHLAPESSASAWPRRCVSPGIRLATGGDRGLVRDLGRPDRLRHRRPGHRGG